MDIREQTIAHLRACSACKELFSEALEVVSDLPEDALNVPTPLEWQNKNRSSFVKVRRIFAVTLPAAAAAAFLFFAPSNTKWSAETMLGGVVTSQNFQVNTNATLPDYQEKILGFSEGISKNKLFFKAGVLATKLEMELQLKNSQQSLQIAQSLQSLLNNPQLKNDDTFLKLLSRGEHNEGDLDFSELGRQLRILETDIAQSSDRFFFQLGLSTEAGKLAALTQNETFFQQYYFKDLLEREKGKQLPPGTIRKLQSIRKLVTDEKLSKNYRQLYQNFEEIQKGLL